MKFRTIITDYVKKEWSREHGTTGVVLEGKNYFHLLLDLVELPFNPGVNEVEAKDYVAYVLCNYLKNRFTKSFVLSCYWMNQYLEHDTIVQIVDQVTQRALEIAAEEV